MEKEIELSEIHPLALFGVNNSNLGVLQEKFPKLKLVARGNSLKILGPANHVAAFEGKLDQIIRFYNSFNRLSEQDLYHLLEGESPKEITAPKKSDVLVFGVGGKNIKAESKNQKSIVAANEKSDMTFAIGPAGTGKTYTAVALAVRALKLKAVKRIIVTRPAVEAGENLGFLPGDLKDKLDPYLQPIYDAFQDMIPKDRLTDFMENGVIQIAPLAYMRGRTLDKAFVILDEAQNATFSQLKMFLTRMGKSAKFVITGDETQIDLPRAHQSGLKRVLGLVKNIPEISVVYLDAKDVVRHPIVEKIITEIEKDSQENASTRKV